MDDIIIDVKEIIEHGKHYNNIDGWEAVPVNKCIKCGCSYDRNEEVPEHLVWVDGCYLRYNRHSGYCKSCIQSASGFVSKAAPELKEREVCQSSSGEKIVELYDATGVKGWGLIDVNGHK
jgi:hypothetical protein